MTLPLFLTIDLDWADDEAIDLTADILMATGSRATWFATHRSSAVERLLERPDQFEVGIHPNYLPASTHGASVEEVLEHMLDLFPEAVSSRSHSVYQSGPQLAHMRAHSPIRVDSSQFLPEQHHVQPFEHLTPAGPLMRLPFVWADDYEMLKPKPEWRPDRLLSNPGYQVLLFHPVHIHASASGKAADGAAAGPALSFERAATVISASGAGRLLSSILDG